MGLSGLILAIVMMLVLALGIIVFVVLYQRRVINHQLQLKEFNRKKQEELMEASIRSEEEERMRVSAELHDDVGATLSSIRFLLGQAARKPGDGSVIEAAKELLDESIQKVRNISHQLQPGTLQYLGLTKSLQSLAELLTRSGQLKVACQLGDPWPSIDALAEVSLYRIMQELLNNIIKHAGASSVEIITTLRAGTGSIRVTHDGEGLTDESYQALLRKPGAIGLKNIETRLKSVGATIFFLSEKAGNQTIIVSLPILEQKKAMPA